MHFQRVPSLYTDAHGQRCSTKVRATPWTAFLPPKSLGPQVKGNPLYQQCTHQITWQLPRTSAVWAHKQSGPLRRGCCSPQYSKIIFSCWPVDIFKAAASTSENVPLTYYLPVALHSLHMLWTPAEILIFHREILCKESGYPNLLNKYLHQLPSAPRQQ